MIQENLFDHTPGPGPQRAEQTEDLLGVSGASFSGDDTYRYRLWRRWDSGPVVTWVMLNPSTADATEDDPTIRRCRGFSRSWRYGGMIVVNLYAYRATNPKDLPTDLPVAQGPANEEHVRRAAEQADVVVAAWGSGGSGNLSYQRALNAYGRRLLDGFDLQCLGVTLSGAPRHPLYVPSRQPLVPWST